MFYFIISWLFLFIYIDVDFCLFFLIISLLPNDGFIILELPGNDNLAADRFLIVCGGDEIFKQNPTHNHENKSRCESTALGSELLNSEMAFLYRVDVGFSLVSTFQIPIVSFEEHCPNYETNCGENSLKEHVPADTMNITEQWRLFSVSFPCEVSIVEFAERNDAQCAEEFKAERGIGIGGGREGGGGGEMGDQDRVSTVMASVLVMSSRTAKQSSLVLIQQSGKICVISYKSVCLCTFPHVRVLCYVSVCVLCFIMSLCPVSVWLSIILCAYDTGYFNFRFFLRYIYFYFNLFEFISSFFNILFFHHRIIGSLAKCVINNRRRRDHRIVCFSSFNSNVQNSR